KVLETTKPILEKEVRPILELFPEEVEDVDSGERLLDKVKERLTILGELDPPRTFDTTKFFEGAQALDEAGVDAITIS
ncbi:bifunctional homocysteine S-methyltransferase/methylenetetrahydrofolate reductase, partial [Listeria monocytogenes]|nr:bifunctional homocysteine S-methyltransferase/methylenetetrahydrofolate reductase [Listeria monocytogenes]